MTSTARRSPARALAWLLAAALVAPALRAAPRAQPGESADGAVDPFYLDLERAGEAARARGDAAAAVRKLRRACFGLLDVPARWGACSVRLALAQSEAGDWTGFQQTFERIVAADARFQVWSAAPLAAGERARFEQIVAERIPPELLRGTPAFAGLALRHEDERLRALPPKQRVRELERLATESGEPHWRIELAEAELERGRPQAALDRLADLPARPAESRVACLRGAAHAGLGHCAPALEAFAGCHPAVDARFAAPALGCLSDLGREAEAARLVAALPAEVKADPEVRRRLAELGGRSGQGPGG